jgi:hypothetical protein
MNSYAPNVLSTGATQTPNQARKAIWDGCESVLDIDDVEILRKAEQLN